MIGKIGGDTAENEPKGKSDLQSDLQSDPQSDPQRGIYNPTCFDQNFSKSTNFSATDISLRRDLEEL